MSASSRFRPGEGDWICENSNCKNVNFAKRLKCNKCGQDRTPGQEYKKTGNEIGKQLAEKSKGLFSADDWMCKACGNVNWARRNTCNMCNAPKFGNMEPRTGYGGGYMEREVNVEYKDKKADSDDEYDEFGRKKKKYRGQLSSDGILKAQSPPRNTAEDEDDEDDDDDDDDDVDVSKYNLESDEDDEDGDLSKYKLSDDDDDSGDNESSSKKANNSMNSDKKSRSRRSSPSSSSSSSTSRSRSRSKSRSNTKKRHSRERSRSRSYDRNRSSHKRSHRRRSSSSSSRSSDRRRSWRSRSRSPR